MSPLRDQRLRTKAEFSRVLSSRHSLSGEFIRVRYARSQADGQPRLGMVVGKRLTGTNVQRNLVRRQISETFRSRSGKLPVVDVVAALRKPCREAVDARRAGAEFSSLLDELAAREAGR